MGISTFGMYKYIYLGEDHDSGYIQIPRGCYDALISYNKNAEIQMMIEIKDNKEEVLMLLLRVS